MTAEFAASQHITVEDYLVGEDDAPQKHEYLAGIVYAMAGATNAHNMIAGNLFIALGVQLRGHGCRPFNSDTKVRIRLADQTRFYYPDVQVVCRPNSLSDHFQDEPVIVFEVVSESTRRVDEVEKRFLPRYPHACRLRPHRTGPASSHRLAPHQSGLRARGLRRDGFRRHLR